MTTFFPNKSKINLYRYFKWSKPLVHFYISRNLHCKKSISENTDLWFVCFKMLQKESLELSLLFLLRKFCLKNKSSIYKGKHKLPCGICELRFLRPKICQWTLNWQKMDKRHTCFKPTIRRFLEKRHIFL